MGKDLFFFTTRKDLLSIVENVEKSIRLKYIKTGIYDSNAPEQYESLLEYEEFGINKSGDHQSESFLVLEKGDDLIVREVEQAEGGVKYFVDQMINENSVVLWPGGMYDNNYLICGHMGTIKTNNFSKQIFNVFQKYIKQQCKNKVGRYYFSDEVKGLNGRLRLITINVKQSCEYDLKL